MLNSANAEYSYKKFKDAYTDLVAWIEGSLPKYRCELEKILLPVFISFYLELIRAYESEKAAQFFDLFYLPNYARDLELIRNVDEPR